MQNLIGESMVHSLWRNAAALAFVVALVMAVPAQGAQGTVMPLPSLPGQSSGSKTPSPPEDPAKVPDFVSRLDDRQARQVLIDTLSARAPVQTQDARDSLGDLAGEAATIFQLAGSRLVAVAAATAALPDTVRQVEASLDIQDAPWLPMLVAGFAILVTGFAAEIATVLLLGRLSFAARVAGTAGRRRKPRWIAARAIGLGAFTAATAVAAELFTAGLPVGQQTLLATLGASLLLVRLADLLATGCTRLLVPPSPAALQPGAGRSLRVGIAAIHAVAAFGAAALGLLHRAGAPEDVRLSVALGLWTLVMIGVGSVLKRLDMLAAPPPPDGDPADGPPFGWLRAHWLGVALTGSFLLWVVTAERALETGLPAIRAGVLTLLVCAYAPAMIRLLAMTLRRVRTRPKEDGAMRQPAWVPAVIRCARVLGALAAAWVIGRIWDVDFVGLASDRFGENAVRAATGVITVVLLAYVAWELVKALVRGNAAASAESTEAATDDLTHVRPASRMQTFLPLVEKFLFVIVVVVAALGIMRALGVDTGPLLAGAGIIGIAIGFGAQTLVRDIVSGIFFLFDDAFRLGEYVEIDQTRGTVEGISIRSLRIRHHRGAVHTVPFGTIQRLTNYSRDWIILKLEFLLAFETDLSKVKKIVKQIGKEMLEDPEFGPHFLEPAKSQGVRRMEQIGMVVGVKFMAKPGEQFILRREVYQRVRDAFEKNGIAFARPQVVVQVPPGAKLRPDEEEAVASAAAEVGLPDEPPPQKKTGAGSHA